MQRGLRSDVRLGARLAYLQVGGQVVTYLTEHLGKPLPSPALFKQIGDRFRDAVRSFAEINGIPVLRHKGPDRSRWDDRKVDHVRTYADAATVPGVVAIVVAQEVQKVFMGYKRPSLTGAPQFGFDKADRRVTEARLRQPPKAARASSEDVLRNGRAAPATPSALGSGATIAGSTCSTA